MGPIAVARVLFVAAGLLLLAGCSSKGQATGAAPNADAPRATLPQRGGEATVLLAAGSSGSWPAGLDPATNTTGGANLSLMNAIFGGLFQLTADDDGGNPQITGVLATGYEFADDGRTLIIHLRPGVKFSDGTPLDAESVRFNVERNLASSCGCAPRRWPWTEQNRATTVDPLTVALHFTRPYPAAINGFPISNVNWIVSPTALEQMGEDEFKIKPVGAGPFRVVSNQLSTKLVLERNPRYWQPERPYLDRLVFQSIGSEQAAYLALLAGDAAAAEGMTSTALMKQAMDEGRITVTQQPATSPYVVQLNTSIRPFDDEKARRAIYYATDVEAIRKGLFSGWYPTSQSFTAPGGLFHHGEIPGYPGHDLEQARRLVAELGGLRVTLGTTQSFVAEQVITALQAQWQQAGIEVSIEAYELARLVQKYQSRDWQALLQTAGSYDPESAAGASFRFRSDQLFSGVHDENLDRMLYDAAGTIDPARRDALYLEAGRYISDKAYAPFLFAFAPAQFTVRRIHGPGLTTRIPPILINTGILWQDAWVTAE